MAAWDTEKLSNLPINTKVIIAEYGLVAKDNVLNYYPVFPQGRFHRQTCQSMRIYSDFSKLTEARGPHNSRQNSYLVLLPVDQEVPAEIKYQEYAMEKAWSQFPHNFILLKGVSHRAKDELLGSLSCVQTE